MERIVSPGGDIVATIDPGAEGGPALAVERAGRTVVEPSPLGVDAHRSYLVDGWTLDGRTDGEVAETFRTARGKRREHSHEATAATLTFARDDLRADLDVRAAPDGVAFRYRVPLDETTMVGGERTAFALPSDAVVWCHPHNENHESTARELPATEADGAFSPPVLATTGEDWLLLAEAGVDGSYAAGRFGSADGDPTFALGHPGTTVWARDELVTPWRVVAVGDLATVAETDLVPALVDGGDGGVDPRAEWVRPGRVAWSWWSGSDSPSDPARQREFVDYAAERGWEYVLVDEGWSAAWVPDLVEYAADRGVGVFLWAHWTELNDARERRERFARWAEWGVAGAKIDFMDHDDQGRQQFYQRAAEDAADHELLLNFHGSVVPTGLSRRYPHVLTYEGVKAAEYLKSRTLAPQHNTVLPFTRNAVGPMDYTPVGFDCDSRHSTAGHELACAVVYESGLVHFADSPEAYAARPAAEAFLERVPAAWDETRLLGGRPGTEATLARLAGDEWFVGSVTAGPARTVRADLSALDGEEAVVVRDGEDGLVRKRREAGEIAVEVPANGGFVARL